MRSPAAFLCALAGALVFNVSASAALTVTEAPQQQSSVEGSRFSEGGAQSYETDRAVRLKERKRAKVRSQVIGILMVVVPVVLIVIVALIFARTRGATKRGRSDFHKLRKELKAAEAKRRAGGSPQMLDPRQW